MKKFLILTLTTVLMAGATQSQAGVFSKKKPAPAPAAAAKPAAKPEDKSGLKPYREIVTKDAQTAKGMMWVHKIKDKYYFEIADSLLGRDIIVVGRISKAPTSIQKQKTGYPGDQVSEEVIRFESGPSNRIFMRNISYVDHSADSTGMMRAVANASIQPIVASFSTLAVRKDTAANLRTYVIDVTDYMKGDKGIFSIDDGMKKNRGIGMMINEASYIDTLKVFPANIEVRTVRTYARVPSTGIQAMLEAMIGMPSTPLTYELNTSMVLLPKVPMRPRISDARVGYFAVSYVDFDANPQGVETRSRITRWRLEPKDEAAYKRGELVEPIKPIVIYIDPATPKKWVPYLIQGVNDWQVAFEQAGFKNAIYALEAPTDDPTWSLEDARHSAIVYKPSDIANASGPHVHDPRSGEILETHINWYHNVMSLLHTWYTVQAGAIDPRARKVTLDDELMGELIRFVSSHEVGHTLGLRHNFGSSATVPVEKLRDKAWVEANGHTPSIMDYARFNYVAQPEDNISEKGIFPRIGIYDKWSIEWGYRWLPQFATPEDEEEFSNKDIIAKMTSDNRYRFGTESDRNDPRNQSEDLGDNAMKASDYGIKNLKRIMPDIIEWTSRPNDGYGEAKILYNNVVSQFSRYMGHVATNIGGIYSNPVAIEQTDPAMQFVPASIQREAVDFLNRQLFTTPTWLIDQKLISKAVVDPLGSIGAVQSKTLERILSKATIDKLSRTEQFGGQGAYTPADLFAGLRKGIWSELTSGRTPDIYRRNLQKNYVKSLIAMTDKPAAASPAGAGAALMAPSSSPTTPSDAAAIARTQLTDLSRDIKRAAAASAGIAKAHYQNLAAIIDEALDNK